MIYHQRATSGHVTFCCVLFSFFLSFRDWILGHLSHTYTYHHKYIRSCLTWILFDLSLVEHLVLLESCKSRSNYDRSLKWVIMNGHHKLDIVTSNHIWVIVTGHHNSHLVWLDSCRTRIDMNGHVIWVVMIDHNIWVIISGHQKSLW